MPPPDSTLPPVTISGLPKASQANTTDQIEVVQGGASRSVTIGQVLDLPLAVGGLTLGGPLYGLSANFSGEVTAATPPYPDNDTSVATTEYVTTAISYVTAKGPAGGDLRGTYPNPTIMPNVVLTGEPTVPGYLALTGGALTGPISGTSASFSGPVTAATPAFPDNDTSVATTAYVTAAILGSGGGPPTGPAGGDLAGDYPNPTIAPGALNDEYLPLTGGTLAGPGSLTMTALTATTGDFIVPAVSGTVSLIGYFSTTALNVAGTGARLYLGAGGSTSRGTFIDGVNTGGSTNAHDLVFSTSAASAAPAEALRLTGAKNAVFAGSINVATTGSFSGNVNFPTQPPGTNNTTGATTAFVTTALGALPPPPTSLPPSGSAGGDLTGSYPNPTIAPGALSDEYLPLAGGTLTGGLSGTTATMSGDITSAANIQVGVASHLRFGTTGARIWSPAAGILRLSDSAGTSFIRLQFGGTTSSFPSIKRNAAALNLRTADDTADIDVTFKTQAAGNATTLGATTAFTTAAITAAIAAIPPIPTEFPPTGAAGGDLTGSYPNPTIAPGALSDEYLPLLGGTLTGQLNSTTTLTGASTPAINVTQTWNNAATTFTALNVNAIDTASNFASNLAAFQVGGATLAAINKEGTFTTLGSVIAGSAQYIYWTARSVISSPADGRIRLTTQAQSGFDRLQFGGTSASFPAIKRNLTALNFRLADDTADIDVTFKTQTAGNNTTLGATTAFVQTAVAAAVGGATPTGPAGGDLSGTYPNPLLKPSVTNGQVMTTVGGVSTWVTPSTGGTVTTVSVASVNGLAGTVATATTTPVISLSTTITGMLKGNGTAISAAVAGTDYMTPANVSGLYLPLAGGTLTGTMVIGTGAPGPAIALQINKDMTGGTTVYGVRNIGVVQSDATASSIYYFSNANTAAAAFTLPSITHYYVQQGTIGAGSAVTNQYGFYVHSSLIGAASNYGVHSNIPTGVGANWNIYANGSAPNYFAGVINQGTSALLAGANVRLTKTITGAVTAYGIYSSGTVQSDVTTGAFYNHISMNTAAAAFTLPNITAYRVDQGTFGAGSTVTNQYGFVAASTLIGGTSSNVGFQGAIPAGTGRYNFYASGTAQNRFEGTTLLNGGATSVTMTAGDSSTNVATTAFVTSAITALPAMPTTLPPSGPASGDLTGTYPAPTIMSSVALAGSPTTTTQAAATNNTTIATTAYVKSQGYSTTLGTVTSASVVSANGFGGTVATATTTPAITLTTSINGMIKGNGTALQLAVAGTDYLTPAALSTALASYLPLAGGTLTGGLTGTTATFSGALTAGAADIISPSVALLVGLVSPVATQTALRFYSGTSTATTGLRWFMGKDGNAESTGNAGSSFRLYAYSDTGAGLGDALTVARATRTIAITVGATVPTPGAVTGTEVINAAWVLGKGYTSSSGTVTGVSVASANGFAGTATATATPVITLTTTVNGMVKGNATALSAAVAGTDYVSPSGLTTALSGYLPLTGGTLAGPGDLTVGGNLVVTNDTSLNGLVGICGVITEGTALRISPPPFGGSVNPEGVYLFGTIDAGHTGSFTGFYTGPTYPNVTMAASAYFGFRADMGTKPAGVTIANIYGFYAGSTLVGGTTSSRGYTSVLPAGTGNWNFYASGTADNAFAGQSRFGSLVDPTATVDVTGTVAISGTLTGSSATFTSTPLIVGSATAYPFTSSGTVLTPAFQVAAATTIGMSVQMYHATFSTPPTVNLSKSKGATVGTYTIVSSTDVLGSLSFNGSDGVKFIEGAAIRAQVDGTPGLDDMPTRLVFYTTSDGSATPTEAMRIASTNAVTLTGTLTGTTTTMTGLIRSNSATAIPAGGTAGTGFTFSSTANFGINFGSGLPNKAVARGSIYLRSDGDAPFVNTDGTTGGWAELATVADLTPPGAIMDYAGPSAPTGWLFCQGQAVSRTTYAALYTALGGAASVWGQGDGTTTFNVPDLMGRVTAGKEITSTRLTTAGAGIDGDTLGAAGGVQTFALATANLAAHIHAQTTHLHAQTTHAHTIGAHQHTSGDHTHTGVGAALFGWINGGTLAGYLANTDQGSNWIGYTAENLTGAVSGGPPQTGGISSGTNTGTSAAVNTGTSAAVDTGSTGTGTAHQNTQPTVIMNKIIKT